MSPKVTVLMSVYNGESYLVQSIDSILKQTFKDIEFIIIDDGSTDKSLSIIKSYMNKDCRIKLIQNEENIGLTRSLNKGLALARGEYIARQDADDISLPDRLNRQVTFMDAHPEIGVCGSWVKKIGSYSHHIWKYPTDNDTIRACLLFTSAMAHPSVIMRKSLLVKIQLFYNPSYKRSQDYELWVRASQYFPLANIGEVLVLYRSHANQVGKVDSTEQRLSGDRVRLLQLQRLDILPTNEELQLHQSVSILNFTPTKNFLDAADNWLQKLKAQNELTSIYSYPAFSTVIGYRWFNICSASAGLGVFAWKRFSQSPLSLIAKLSWEQKIKFWLKCSMKWTRSIG